MWVRPCTCTYVWLRDWEFGEQFDTPIIISSSNGSTRWIDMCRIDVCFVSIFRPNTLNFFTKNAIRKEKDRDIYEG